MEEFFLHHLLILSMGNLGRWLRVRSTSLCNGLGDRLSSLGCKRTDDIKEYRLFLRSQSFVAAQASPFLTSDSRRSGIFNERQHGSRESLVIFWRKEHDLSVVEVVFIDVCGGDD